MRVFLFVALSSGLVVVAAGTGWTSAQDQSSRIFVNVVLVQLNVAVSRGERERGDQERRRACA